MMNSTICPTDHLELGGTAIQQSESCTNLKIIKSTLIRVGAIKYVAESQTLVHNTTNNTIKKNIEKNCCVFYSLIETLHPTLAQ